MHGCFMQEVDVENIKDLFIQIKPCMCLGQPIKKAPSIEKSVSDSENEVVWDAQRKENCFAPK